MRAEVDAFVGDRAQLRQREDLEATAVREDRLIPVHELMETARRTDDFAARTKVQMVGVAEQNLRTRLLDLLRGHAFHRRLRTYGHEDRCLDLAMRRLQHAQAGGRLRVGLEEREHGLGPSIGDSLARWQGRAPPVGRVGTVSR